MYDRILMTSSIIAVSEIEERIHPIPDCRLDGRLDLLTRVDCGLIGVFLSECAFDIESCLTR